MRIPSQVLKQIPFVVVVCIFLGACGRKSATPSEASSAAVNPSVNYASRIGIAVATPTRACMAIRNATLSAGSTLTLVSAKAPQTYMPAQVSGISGSPCPVTKEVDSSVTSYDIKGAPRDLQSLSPLIAVVAAPAVFTSDGNSVRADLDQNGNKQLFRICSADDGVHLSVWSGNPLAGQVIWHGHFFEESNPGIGPACTPPELNP